MERLVLRPEVSRDDIDDALVLLGFQLTNIVPASAGTPAQLIFAASDAGSYVHLVEDAQVGRHYLVAPPAAARHVAALASALAIERPEQARARVEVASSDGELAASLLVLALVVGGERPPAPSDVAALRSALSHTSPLVRSVALAAACYAPWAELRPALEERALAESGGDLRGRALEVLASFPEG